jgi:hypothetical protein
MPYVEKVDVDCKTGRITVSGKIEDERNLPNYLAPRKELERRNTVLKSATAEMTNAEKEYKRTNGRGRQPFAEDWCEDE